MSDSTLYLRAAEALRHNPGQWAAYESRGHCVVLAGPGSGKTKVLTTKIARQLAEDVAEPRGIACITYNNECARELETRLEALGVKVGGRVFVGTIHSFSLTQIILPYAKLARLGLPEKFRIATQRQKRIALQNALTSIGEDPANAQDCEYPMSNYRRKIIDRTSTAWRDTDPELANLVVSYEQELRNLGLIDFDDMPLLALQALRANQWLRRALLAKYPILVVDEYQDLGRALHSIVLGLCFSTGMRLFAVGDPDQSIYGFNGAHPELLRKLSKRDDVETINLTMNYRSGSEIVAAASHALGEEREFEPVKGAPEGAVFLHSLKGRYEAQAELVVKDLLPKVFERHPGLRYGDIAILYPAAWLGDTIAAAAKHVNIPILRTDGNALYPRSSRLMQWLEQCASWCCGGWNLGNPRFLRIANDGRRLFSDAVRDADQNRQFHQALVASLWKTRTPAMPVGLWLTQMQAEIISPYEGGHAALEDELNTLKAFIKRTSEDGDCQSMTLGEFSGHCEGLDSVNLSTLHSAKGREFSVVFLFGMDNGRLPRHGISKQELAEARRVFYVGFTRAKMEIHLIHTVNQASPFVDEVKRRIEP